MSEFTLQEPDVVADPEPTKLRLRQVPGMGSFPLPPGELLDSEMSELRPFGWQEGDPVPPDFAGRLAKARQEIADDIKSGKLQERDPKTGEVRNIELPAFRAPAEIPADRLPQAKQQELRRYLEDYKAAVPYMEQMRQDDLRLSNLDPSVQKAIRATMIQDGVEVIDSRTTTEPTTEVKTQPEAKASTPATETKDTLETCPHCLNDLRNPAAAEPSKEDMANFVIAILGNRRFSKEYSYLKGQLRATFRALTSRHADMISDQVSIDQQDGKIRNLEDLFRIGFGYRLALTLDMLVSGGQPLSISQAVDNFLSKPPRDEAALPALVKRLQAKPPLNNESVWNILSATARRFGDLVRVLQDRADQPNFWNAIEA